MTFPWTFYVMIAALVVLPVLGRLVDRLVKEWLDDRRFARAGLQDVRRMHWRDFEKYLGHLFRSLGYQVEVTPPTNDYGVDLILTDASGRRTAVQAKHWKNQAVGGPVVQQTIGAAQYYQCQQVMIVTTSGYTDAAREVAQKTGVLLWGIKELGDAMEQVRARGGAPGPAQATAVSRIVAAPGPRLAQQPGAPRLVTAAKPLGLPVKPAAAKPASPTCPACGSQMALRMAQGREIWLCTQYPGCKGYKFRDETAH